jgi:hypothetical protein
MPEEPRERDLIREGESGTSVVGYALIKYSATVIITIAILYFLARYVLPLF